MSLVRHGRQFVEGAWYFDAYIGKGDKYIVVQVLKLFRDPADGARHAVVRQLYNKLHGLGTQTTSLLSGPVMGTEVIFQSEYVEALSSPFVVPIKGEGCGTAWMMITRKEVWADNRVVAHGRVLA